MKQSCSTKYHKDHVYQKSSIWVNLRKQPDFRAEYLSKPSPRKPCISRSWGTLATPSCFKIYPLLLASAHSFARYAEKSQFVRMSPWLLPSDRPINQPINDHITKHQGSHCPTFSGSPGQRVHSHLQRWQQPKSYLSLGNWASCTFFETPKKPLKIFSSLCLYHYHTIT